ncbi:phosphatase PAP2 family protein [Paractinoplanes durhamensis]|uniref:phosphatase PAP2 family protein n=1 Tax=Paractinoplanes durhamensis TaxID=113563 RepID=UPI003631808E
MGRPPLILKGEKRSRYFKIHNLTNACSPIGRPNCKASVRGNSFQPPHAAALRRGRGHGPRRPGRSPGPRRHRRRLRRRLQDERHRQPDGRHQRGRPDPLRHAAAVADRHRLEHRDRPRRGHAARQPALLRADHRPPQRRRRGPRVHPGPPAPELRRDRRPRPARRELQGGRTRRHRHHRGPGRHPRHQDRRRRPRRRAGRLRTRCRLRHLRARPGGHAGQHRPRRVLLGQPQQGRLPVPAPLADERGQSGGRHRRGRRPRLPDLRLSGHRRAATAAPAQHHPAEDGGFPSGHTNAFYLAALAFAYAVPERFQELVTAAFDLAETRIVAGMHSPST